MMRRWLLPLVICALLLVIGARADEQSLYAAHLTSVSGGKVIFALTDLSGDLSPEMALIRVRADRQTELSLFTCKENAISRVGETINLAGFRSATMQKRAGDAGEEALIVNVVSASDGASVQTRLVYTDAGLQGIYEARSTRQAKTYRALSRSVTAAGYKAAWDKVLTTYPKSLGKVAASSFAAPKSAQAVRTALLKARAAFLKRETITRISFRRTSAVMTAGRTLTVKHKIAPAGAIHDGLTWRSTDAKVATVNQGVVQALSAGSCEIVAESHLGVCRKLRLTVRSAPPVLSQSAVTLPMGSTVQLQADVEVTWSSANPKIASVNAAGVVTGLKAGAKTTIRAKTPDGVVSSCKVSVTKAVRQPVIIDISEYNTVTSWEKLSRSVDLVILRCGITRKNSGNRPSIDSKFASYAAQLNKYHIPFGVYYYGRASTAQQAQAEAQACVNYASAYAPRFYVYDCEETSLNKTSIKAFVAQTRELTGGKVGLYVANHLYGTYGLNTGVADFLWIPRYGSNSGKPETAPVYACDLWQYTSNGSVAGISGRVDMSKLNSSKPFSFYLS